MTNKPAEYSHLRRVGVMLAAAVVAVSVVAAIATIADEMGLDLRGLEGLITSMAIPIPFIAYKFAPSIEQTIRRWIGR